MFSLYFPVLFCVSFDVFPVCSGLCSGVCLSAYIRDNVQYVELRGMIGDYYDEGGLLSLSLSRFVCIHAVFVFEVLSCLGCRLSRVYPKAVGPIPPISFFHGCALSFLVLRCCVCEIDRPSRER